MRKYLSYKSSGVDWIGDIPEHWESLFLKRKCNIKRGASPRPIDDPKYFDDNGYYSWVRISDVTSSGRYLTKTEQRLSEIGSSLSVKLEENELFLSIAGSVGKPIITQIPCCVHDGFVWFQNLNINSEFLYYIFMIGQCFSGLGKFGTQLNLNTDTVGCIRIPLPSKSEQRQIVQYLDEKTEIIDKLLSTKERKIELLKQQRTSLINQVITKGLDTNVKMKDSGVEWIGEMPDHWKLKPLKYISQITLGKMLTPEDKGGYFLKPYLRSKNIQIDNVDVSDIKEMWFSGNELEKYRLETEDILVNEGGDVGRSCIWKNELDECYIQNSVNRVKITNGSNNYYLYHFFLHYTTGYFNSIVDRVSIPHLTKEKLENVFFLIPPLPEQKQIVDYIDKNTKEIDDLISLEQKKIDLLKEYRQSLIAEVITGKIDVRSN